MTFNLCLTKCLSKVPIWIIIDVFHIKMVFYKNKIQYYMFIRYFFVITITQVLFLERNSRLCYSAEVLYAYLPFLHMSYGLKLNKINHFFYCIHKEIPKWVWHLFILLFIKSLIFIVCASEEYNIISWINEWISVTAGSLWNLCAQEKWIINQFLFYHQVLNRSFW